MPVADPPPSPAVSGEPGGPAPAARGARVRMSPEERRRQLVGIGLRTFVEHPVQDVSLDAVAAEAGVSRGLLFHYFPTKTDFHRAVVGAAGRRMLRTVRPDEGTSGDVAVAQVVDRFLAQVARRREFYLALVYGQLPGGAGSEDAAGGTAATLREGLAGLVIAAAGLPTSARPAAQGWVAYLEDRALQWSAPDRVDAPSARDEVDASSERDDLVAHCVRALHALTDLPTHTTLTAPPVPGTC